eukprot:GHVT01063630.1.p1 GENE.GHVT01063630.1~~GHVT01063630.1.p1  ORF type:complete len:141 (+),score=26.19 GHVT01063630.1:2181-2603(+)
MANSWAVSRQSATAVASRDGRSGRVAANRRTAAPTAAAAAVAADSNRGFAAAVCPPPEAIIGSRWGSAVRELADLPPALSHYGASSVDPARRRPSDSRRHLISLLRIGGRRIENIPHHSQVSTNNTQNNKICQNTQTPTR